jgi:crotonobetaine/carnitine-CoA ligase
VLKPRFSRSAFWQQVRDAQATVFPFVGDIAAILAKEPATAEDRGTSLRVAFGQPIPARLHPKFETALGTRLVHLYGSTEATIPIWASSPTCTPGSAGTVIAGFDVEIRDETDRPVPPGVVGEITVQAHAPFTMASGYLRDEDNTSRAFRNGWFHTRDLGAFDTDGQLWVHGRAGDAIRHRGQFINVSEIEQIALAHEAIQMAAAYGVPSELVDDDIMIAVTLSRPGALTREAVWEWLMRSLPRDHLPAYVDILDELPLTRTGKVRKTELRERGVTGTAARFGT